MRRWGKIPVCLLLDVPPLCIGDEGWTASPSLEMTSTGYWCTTSTLNAEYNTWEDEVRIRSACCLLPAVPPLCVGGEGWTASPSLEMTSKSYWCMTLTLHSVYNTRKDEVRFWSACCLLYRHCVLGVRAGLHLHLWKWQVEVIDARYQH